MSRIKSLIEHLDESTAYDEMKESTKTAVTIRLEEEDIWRLEHLSNQFGMKRATFAIQLMEQALFEAMEALGLDLNEQKCMFISKKSGKPIKEVRVMLSKTGFSSTEDEVK